METNILYVGGGCFWGLEELFRQQPGVVDTEVGYAGGHNQNPTYRNHPGHAETVAITYNPQQTSVKKLLDYFFRVHNPTTPNQQGNDKGESYRSVIFYQNEEERQQAEDMVALVESSDRWGAPIVTQIEAFSGFYPAEEDHQDYLQKYPNGYTCHFVRFEDSFLEE